MSKPVSRDAILASIRSNRTQIENLWTGLTPNQMTERPGPQEDWSVKDLIAHLTWWEQRCVTLVDAYVNGHDIDGIEDFDAVNAHIFEENKDRPLEDILDDFDNSLPILIEQIESLSEDALNHPIDDDGNFVYTFYDWDCYGHYPAHLEDMQRYVARIE